MIILVDVQRLHVSNVVSTLSKKNFLAALNCFNKINLVTAELRHLRFSKIVQQIKYEGGLGRIRSKKMFVDTVCKSFFDFCVVINSFNGHFLAEIYFIFLNKCFIFIKHCPRPNLKNFH